MPKSFIRVVTFWVMGGLLLDPHWVQAFQSVPSQFHAVQPVSLFLHQALLLPQTDFTHPSFSAETWKQAERGAAARRVSERRAAKVIPLALLGRRSFYAARAWLRRKFNPLRAAPRDPSLTPSLFDDVLPDLFYLDLLGRKPGQPVGPFFERLFKVTGHHSVSLLNYTGEYVGSLHEALFHHNAEHPQALRLNKPIHPEKIRIVLMHDADFTYPLPWRFLIYVDGDTIVIHEAFLAKLHEGRGDESIMHVIKELTEVFGHENAERDLPGQPGMSHERAQHLFPATQRISTRFLADVKVQLAAYQEAGKPDDNAVPPPPQTVPVSQKIDQAIQSAYNEFKGGSAAPAESIVAAFVRANRPQSVQALPSAIAILRKANRPEWKPLLAVLIKYSRYGRRAQDSEHLLREAKDAIFLGEALVHRGRPSGDHPSFRVHSFLPPLIFLAAATGLGAIGFHHFSFSQIVAMVSLMGFGAFTAFFIRDPSRQRPSRWIQWFIPSLARSHSYFLSEAA